MFDVTFVEEFCTGIIKFRRGRVEQRHTKWYLDVWDIQGETKWEQMLSPCTKQDILKSRFEGSRTGVEVVVKNNHFV